MKRFSQLLFSSLLVLLFFTGCTKEVKVYYSSYLVIFNANGGSGNDRTQVFNEDKEKTLLPNTFTKNGFDFIGWLSAPKQEYDSSGNPKYQFYTDRQSIKISDDITLYAQWEKSVKRTIPLETKKTLPIHYTQDSNTARWPANFTSLDVYFQKIINKDGTSRIINDIPFISMETASKLFEAHLFFGETTDNTSLTVHNHIFTFTRNNETVKINFDENTVYFSERNEFLKPSENLYALDFITQESVYYNNGVRNYINIDTSVSYFTRGQPRTIDLNKYNIPLILNENGQGFIPLQTFTDLFWREFGGFGYNGEGLYLFGNNNEALNQTYFNNSQFSNTTISEDLQKFNYNELCFEMDNFYGLKEQHNISSFNEYINTLEVKEKVPMIEYFYNSDPLKQTYALFDLLACYIDDLHSNYLQGSPYLTWNTITNNVNTTSLCYSRRVGVNFFNITKNTIFLQSLRLSKYKDLSGNSAPQNTEFKMYDELIDGNNVTIVLTFDSFTADISKDYYIESNRSHLEELVNANNASLIELILYTQGRINQLTSAGKSIKNIIIDISLNGGGRVDSAIFLTNWLRQSTPLSIKDTFTNGKYNITYNVDTNYNHHFEDTDCISVYTNVYCITSLTSFSCGNLVPFSLKQNGATIIGQQSGGGTCSVLPRTTADGQYIAHSSTYEIEKNKNGIYYNVDSGIEPDIYIKDFSNIYNRVKLLEIINNLN